MSPSDKWGGALLRTVQEHAYSREVCFLCGVDLADSNRSDEHVVPRWVQRRFELRDRSITLLNRASIAYRRLTIPCCEPCNNGPLSRLERRAKEWLRLPVQDLRSEQELDLFLWASKILFGLIYRQLFMAIDPRDRGGAQIVTAEAVRHFDNLHRLLQGIRSSLRYAGPTALPGSFVVFDVQCPDDVRAQFDWHDSVGNQALYVRLGDRAILLALDGGAQEVVVGGILARHRARSLHPLQMEELAAKFLYKSETMERWPVFTFADDGQLHAALLTFQYPEAPAAITTIEARQADGLVHLIHLPQPHPQDDGRTPFGDWNRDDYLQQLSRTTRLPVAMLGPADGTTVTFLTTPDGLDLVFGFEEQPYPIQ